MKILVTGSAGHLGEALMRSLPALGHAPLGIDVRPSPYTQRVGSIADAGFVRDCMDGMDAVLHAATLHKPHIATHTRQQFVDTNISGTLNLLEAAVACGVSRFVYTSTTSTFGDALRPPPDQPTAWITEDVRPIPKNIYGITKLAAEDLCALFQRLYRLPCVVLRTSRFFPEGDDDSEARSDYADANLKVNEFLYRRVDVEDVVGAQLAALARAPDIGFARYIISATAPFSPDDVALLRHDAAAVVRRYVPGYAAEFARRGWRMLPGLDRVYVNTRARQELGWQPKHDFASVIARLARDEDFLSPLARAVGRKGYHGGAYPDGLYPVTPG